MKQMGTNGAGTAGTARAELADWKKFRLLKQVRLDQLVEERQQTKAKIDRLEERLEELNGEIEPALVAAGLERVRVGEWKVSIVPGRAASPISGERLLELGVEAEVVEAARIEGKEYTQLRIEKVEKRERVKEAAGGGKRR